MRVIDLSQKLKQHLQTFPTGPETEPESPPRVEIKSEPLSRENLRSPWRMLESKMLSRIPTSGYNWINYRMDSHAGTHIDSPFHFIQEGTAIDQVPLELVVGEARVLDMSDHWVPEDPILRITGDEIIERQDELRGKIVLFYTGWADKREFGSNAYFIDFPTISPEVGEGLVEVGVKSFGVDAPSPDALDSEFENHLALLGAGIPIIENLCNLKQLLPYSKVIFAAAPLKVEGGDASPIRAFAIVEE